MVEDIKCRIHQSGALVEVIFDESSNFYNIIHNGLTGVPLYITNNPIGEWNGESSFILKKPTAKRDDVTDWTETYVIKMNVKAGNISQSQLFQIEIYYPNNTSNKPYIKIN